MSARFPLVLAACEAVTKAMAQVQAAKTRGEQVAADRASGAAERQAVAAYGDEMLAMLFGWSYRLSSRNSRWPAGVISRRRVSPRSEVYHHYLFDHPLVCRQVGTSGPDSIKNTIIVGRPYSAVADGVLQPRAREGAAEIAAAGWGVWWRPDLSAWYLGWTQLVIAGGQLQACGTPRGFLPIASPGLGVHAWDGWQSLPASAIREHMDERALV